MIDLDILFIRDLKQTLNLKDNRSVYAFLKNYHVEVYDKSSKRPYILKVSYERAMLQKRIHDLKTKHGNKWLQVIQSEMQIYSNHKAILEGLQTPASIPKKENPTYGPLSTQFLRDLQSL